MLSPAWWRRHVAPADERRPCGANRRMNRRAHYLLVGLAFALHNGEEALAARGLLRFMQSEAPGFLGHVYAGITVVQLRADLLVVTVLGFAATAAAVRFSTSSASALGMLVFAALLGLNALLHVGLSVAAGSCMPGLGTAVLITLPVSATLLLRARREAWVSTRSLWAVVPIAALLHGPVLGVFLRTSSRLMRG